MDRDYLKHLISATLGAVLFASGIMIGLSYGNHNHETPKLRDVHISAPKDTESKKAKW